MDPISLAIITAVAVGITAGSGKVSEQAVVDAYNGLKSLIKRKFGDTSEVAKAVEGVETRPESDARKADLKEEVGLAKANDDAEIVKAAQELLEKIKQQPGGVQQVQQIASGNYIAQASHGGTASVNIDQLTQDKK
jgi:phage terminase small subunit